MKQKNTFSDIDLEFSQLLSELDPETRKILLFSTRMAFIARKNAQKEFTKTGSVYEQQR